MTSRLTMLALLLAACNGGKEDPSASKDDTPDVPASDTDDPSAGLLTPKDPGPPSFPATIDVLSVAVKTGTGGNDGTNDNTLSLCLTDTDCYTLNVADVDDFRRGEFDVYHFEGINLPRSQVDRVELRSVSGGDMWSPTCLEVRFDGEPMYCHDNLDLKMGDGGGDEVESFRDNLRNRCDTCYDAKRTHGPYMGFTTPDSATIWVRTDATRQVALKVASDPADLEDAPVVAWAYPSPKDDFTGKLKVEGAEPDTTYHYAVQVEGGAVQEAGTFTTAPAGNSSVQMRVAYGSCSKDDAQPIFTVIDGMKPDLFLFVGDNHYANSDDLDSLRWYYRWGLERPPRAAMMAHTPTLATWDDHDYVGNNTDGHEPGRDVALRAFKEYWTNDDFGTAQTNGVFFRHSHGDVDFFFLDDRYWRDFDNSILGAAQTAWLERELTRSDATFKFLISGSRFTSHGSSDSWASYPAATNALYDHIRDNNVTGVVLLSGDIHRSDFRVISHPGLYGLPELTSSPLARPASGCSSDPEQIACYDNTPSFVSLDINTTLDDPKVTANLHSLAGTVVYSRSFRASDLR